MNNTEAPTYFTGKHAVSMELRDYFAAKSIAWFLTKLDDEGLIDDPDLHRQFAASHAYKMADAMLKAREE
jgi:hypothetical protein